MAQRKSAPKRSSNSSKPKGSTTGSGKVGSDRAADHAFGGKGDFGIPAAKVTAPLPDGGREKGPEQGTGPMRSGSAGTRTDGVGHAPGSPGAGSGGDVDPDFIGLDGQGSLSTKPASGRTRGPDITEGGSDAFASGGPAKGENETRRGTHGAPTEVIRGSTVDRSGGDASTTGMGGGSDSATRAEGGIDDAAAGEISSGEAGGTGQLKRKETSREQQAW
jgi:hypothetical protein